jgi:DNA relaxase NicK
VAALDNPSTTVLETAIDWLTVSSKYQQVVRRWASKCMDLQKLEKADGNQTRPWHLNQYQGQMCGRVRFGFSSSAMLVQLSGQTANDLFPYFWKDHDTITRLDIAVTYRTLESDNEQSTDAYRQALAYRADRPKSALPLLVRDGDGGSTLYVGSRASSRLLRLYNKHAESIARRDPASTERYVNAWRVELELHDVDAQAVGMMLAEPGAAAPKIRYYLGHYLGTHGITCPFAVTQEATLPTGFRRRSDRESRLEWLKKSVRPSVDWLKGSCTPEELRGILGLNYEIDSPEGG